MAGVAAALLAMLAESGEAELEKPDRLMMLLGEGWYWVILLRPEPQSRGLSGATRFLPGSGGRKGGPASNQLEPETGKTTDRDRKVSSGDSVDFENLELYSFNCHF